VGNLGASLAKADGVGLKVELMIFSPTQKVYIFH
jgi:hypothetical protein